MDFLLNTELNIGIFYNILICIILGVSSFALVRKVTPRFEIVNNQPTFYNNYLRYFWLNTGFFWMLTAARLFFHSRNDIVLDKIVFYISLILLSVGSVFFFLYGLSVLFKKYLFSPFFAFVSALLGGAFLFFAILEGVTVGEQSLWNVSWNLTYFTQDLFIYSVYFFGLAVALLGALREFYYYAFGKLDVFNSRHIYAGFGFLGYYILFFNDFLGIESGWNLVLVRVLLLIPIFVIYYGFAVESVSVNDKYVNRLGFLQRIFTRRPLLLKAIILVLLVSLIPLSLAAIFIYLGVITFFETNGIVIDAQVIDFIRGQIILIVLVTGILTFFISLSWVRSLVLRLRFIYKGTQEISSGNFEYYIDEAGSKDEIRLLSYLANQISYYLQEYKNTVLESSHGLESRVAERTEQLEQKNQELNSLVEKNNDLLGQLQSRTDLILENMAEGLLILKKDLTIVRVNHYFKEQFSISENILDTSFEQLNHYEQFQEMKDFIHGFLENSLEEPTLTIPAIGDKEFDIKLKISQVELQEGEFGVMILSHDISPPWGVVKDSESKSPIKLAMVRLIDAQNNQVIDTEVTDPNGRFGFFVAPGKYLVSVMKDGFHFPSKIGKGYQGEMIEIQSSDEGAIKFDIYMDPVIDADDWGNDKTMVVKQRSVNTEDLAGGATEKNIDITKVDDLLTVQELQKQNKE